MGFRWSWLSPTMFLMNAAPYSGFGLMSRGVPGTNVWGRKFARIANDICHGRLSPAFVDLGMTLLARFRADVVSGTCSDSLLRLFFPGLLAQAADKKD